MTRHRLVTSASVNTVESTIMTNTVKHSLINCSAYDSDMGGVGKGEDDVPYHFIKFQFWGDDSIINSYATRTINLDMDSEHYQL